MNWRGLLLAGWLLLAGSAWAGSPATLEACIEPVRPLPARTLPKSLLPTHDVGQLTLIEWSGDYSRGRTEARQQVARSFLAQHVDDYDALIVFTSFEFDSGGAAAFYNPIRNDVAGIGIDSFDFSADFGSTGRLAGIVDMAALGRWQLNPRHPQYPDLLGAIGHELLHRWTARPRYRTAAGTASSDLLGADGLHWSWFLDTDGSLMYGNDWAELPDGSGFESVEVRRRLSALDLYLAGFAAPAEVAPLRLIRGGSGSATDLPRRGARSGGSLELVGLDQVIAVEGERVPDAASAPRRFRAALVLLLRPGEAPDPAVLVQLEQLRIRLQEYFQALTLGRASLRVDSAARPLASHAGPAFLLGPTPAAGPARPPEQVIAALLQALQQRQLPDGRFEDLPATVVRDTAMALQALEAFEPQAPGLALARQWLAARQPRSRDEQAWIAAALPLAPASWAAQQLADGSYGLQAGWPGSAWDTALAARALRRSGQASRSAAALQWLGQGQLPGGGFGYLRGGAPRPAALALIAEELALGGLPDGVALLERSRAWLEARQFADGGFGLEASNLHDSVSVLAAAERLQLGATRRALLQQFVLDRSAGTDAIERSVYLSALTLQALALARGPNLAIEGPLELLPAAPLDGQLARLGATVRNTGSSALGTSVARFHDGDPAAGGSPIGTDLLVPALAAGQAMRIETSWDTRDRPGAHQLWLLADVLEQLQEAREDDNRARLEVLVRPAPALPELALAAAETRVSPAALDGVPTLVRVVGRLHNLGSVPVAGAVVALDAVHGSGSTRLAQRSLDLTARGSVEFALEFEQLQPVALELRLRADPGQLLAEPDESNNEVALLLPFGPSVDLELRAADVLVEPAGLAAGDDGRVRLRLRNRGSSNAPPATLLVEELAAGSRREIARLEVVLNAGATLERSLPWRPSRSGALTLELRLDPDNQVAETDEANNRVLHELAIAEPAGINLAPAAGSLLLSPDPPREGQPLQLSMQVQNLGAAAAGAFTVAAYDGDPGLGGVRLGATLVPGLPAQGTSTVELLLPALALRGERTLYLLVDSEQDIAERNENDNLLPRVVEVLGLPDLVLGTGALQLQPAQPLPGETVQARLRVDNLGGQAAVDVLVRLYRGLPGQGAPIAPERRIAMLAAGASVELNWSFEFDGAIGDGLLGAFVDPDDAIVELSAANNRLSLVIGDQQAAAFASEPWFSPNGDGVKDRTTLLFRAVGAASHQLRIRDGAGRVIRSQALLPGSAAPLRFEWDGRDDAGQLVLDGTYEALAEAADGSVVGPVAVVLDTNRLSAFAALDTPFAHWTARPAGAPLPPANALDQDALYFPADHATVQGVNVSGLARLDLAAGVAQPWLRKEFWLQYAQGAQLRTASISAVAYAPDGQALLLVVLEAPASGPLRSSLWRLPLGAPALPLRLAQVAGETTVLGSLGPGRVLLGQPQGTEYQVLDLATHALQPFRSFTAPGLTERVLADGLLRGDSDSLSFVPADPARPVLELARRQPEQAFFEPQLNASASHLLLRSDQDGLLRVELVEVRSGTRRLLRSAPLDLLQAPAAYGSLRTPARQAKQFSSGPAQNLQVRWLDDRELLLVDALQRRSLVYDAAGHLHGEHDLGPVRRSGPFDGTPRLDRRHVVQVYPQGLYALLSNRDPWDGSARLALGETAFYCYAASFSPCATVTGSGFDAGLVDFYVLAADGRPLAEGGRSGAPLLQPADQLYYPLLDTGSTPVRAGQPARYFASGAVQLASGQFLLRQEQRVTTASVEVQGLWHGESHVLAPQGVLSSRQNLSVALQAQPLGRSVRLRGSVSDAALQGWELSYAAEGSEQWRSLSGPQVGVVLDQVLLDWLPPGPGAWRLRLSAVDRAGNQRQAFALAEAGGLPPALVDVQASARALSPNGDGFHDLLQLSFRVDRPIAAVLELRSAVGNLLHRAIPLSYGSTQLGLHSIELDGRDAAGQLLADGDYWIELEGFRLPLRIDTQAPAAALRWDVPALAVTGPDDPLHAGAVLQPQLPERDQYVAALLGSQALAGDPAWIESDYLAGSYTQLYRGLDEALQRRWRLSLLDELHNRSAAVLPPLPPQLALSGLFRQQPWLPLPAEPGAEPRPLLVLPTDPLQALWIDASSGLSELRVEARAAPGEPWRLRSQHPGTRTPLGPQQLPPRLGGHALLTTLDLSGEAAGTLLQLRGSGRTLAGQQLQSGSLALLLGQLEAPQPPLAAGFAELPALLDSRCSYAARVRLPLPLQAIQLRLRPAAGQPEQLLPGRYDASQGGHLLYPGAVPDGSWQLRAEVVDGDGVARVSGWNQGGCGPGSPLASGESLQLLQSLVVSDTTCGAPASPRLRVRIQPFDPPRPAAWPRQLRLVLQHPLSGLDETLQQVQVAAHTALPAFERIFAVDGWPVGRHAIVATISAPDHPDVVIPLALEVLPSHGPPLPRWRLPAAGALLCGREFSHAIEDARLADYADPAQYQSIDLIREWGAGAQPSQWLPIETLDEAGGRLRLAPNEPFPRGPTTLRLRRSGPDGAVGCATQLVQVDPRSEAFPRGPATPALPGALPGLLGIGPNGAAPQRQLQVPFTALEPVQWRARLLPRQPGTLAPAGAVLGELLAPVVQSGDFDLRWDGRLGGVLVADGHYLVETSATDQTCGHVERFLQPLLVDATPPSATLSHPAEGAQLDASVIEFRGSVADAAFASYVLEVAAGTAPGTWQELVRATDPPAADAVLGRFVRGSASGPYRVRLTVTDAFGQQTVVQRGFVLGAAGTLLGAVVLEPELFSPNGDGQFDATRIEVEVRRPLLLSAGLYRGTQLLRSLATDLAVPAGTRVLGWDGRDAANVVVADGEVSLELRAVDAAAPAMVETTRLQLRLDTTAPVLAGLPEESADLGCSTELRFDVADPHLLHYTARLRDATGTLLREIEHDRAGPSSFGTLSPFQAHAGLQLQLEALDRAGNRSTAQRTLGLDCSPPTALLQAPAEAAVVPRLAGRRVPISGTALDPRLAHYRLELAPAGSTDWTLLQQGAAAVESGLLLDWQPLQADGEYQLRLQVEDRAGNRASAERRVHIDGTPPLLVLTAPLDQAVVNGTLEVRGSATDAHFERYAVQLARPAAAPAWDTLLEGQGAVADGLLATLELPLEGDFLLRLQALDQAGLEATTVPRRLRIDTVVPPAPLQLAARVEDNRNVRLSWQGADVADLAGFRIERNGVPLNAQLQAERSYLDLAVPDGEWRYQVLAVDQAGNTSPPSAPALARIDLAPPAVALALPVAGERLRGSYAVLGTAWSADDFGEYALEFQATAPPAAAVELRRSPLPVQSGELALFDTRAIVAETAGVLRLRALDRLGNAAQVERPIVVDNQPPAAPTGLAALQQGDNVRLQWNPNPETDLLGYLAFRNGSLVGVSGPVPADLRVLALAATSIIDPAVGDGLHAWRVYAIDQAGNLSAGSTPAQLEVETGPPDLQLLAPAFNAAFESSIEVIASSADLDVVEVKFAWRVPGNGSWSDFASVAAPPFRVSWTPPAGTAFGAYELRAVARDDDGLADPTPPQVRVRYADLTAPSALTGFAARARGGQVELAWGASAATDLRGYEVQRYRGETYEILLRPQPQTATELVDLQLPDGDYRYEVYAVDTSGNRSVAVSDTARVFDLQVQQPYTPTRAAAIELRGHAGVAGELHVLHSPALPQPLAPLPTADDGQFLLPALPLAAGNNVLLLEVRSAEDDRSRPLQLHLDRGNGLPAPTGLVGPVAGQVVQLAWDASAAPELAGWRLLHNGQPLPAPGQLAQPVSAGGSCCDPELALDGDLQTAWTLAALDGGALDGELLLQWSQPALVERVELAWLAPALRAADLRLQAWSGQHWITVVEAAALPAATRHSVRLARPYRTTALRLQPLRAAGTDLALAEIEVHELPLLAEPRFDHPVPDGQHRYQVIAYDWYGFDSPPSAPPLLVGLGDIEPPPAVQLQGSVAGNTIELQWSASAAPDLAHYLVERDGQPLALRPAAAPRLLSDAGLANGRYRYRVSAIDATGNHSTPSNLVELDVAAEGPGAPRLDRVSALPAGAALELAWTAASGGAPAVRFHVERAASAAGPYTALASTAALTLQDSGLVDGQAYWYQVIAEDAAGNRSAPSNARSGIPGDSSAPSAPQLHYPALPGHPLRWDTRQLDLCGQAEPGVQVQLRRAGLALATPLVALPTLRLQRLPAFEAGRLLQARLAPDGQRYFREYDRFDVRAAELRGLDAAERLALVPIPVQARFAQRGDELFGLDPDNGRLLRYGLETGSSGNGTPMAAELDRIEAYAFDAAASRFVLYGRRGVQVGLWRFERGSGEVQAVAGVDLPSRPAALALDFDGERLLLADAQGGLRLLDLASGQLTALASGLDPALAPPQLAADGQRVAWLQPLPDGVAELRVQVPGVPASILLHAFAGPSPRLLRFSPDGRTLGVLDDASLRRWTLAGVGAEIAALPLDTAPAAIADLQWAASGRLLLQPTEFQIGQLAIIDPPGQFCLRQVSTVPGSNAFDAIGLDALGNASAPGAVIRVDVPASGLPDLAISAADLRFSPPGGAPGSSFLAFVTLHNRGVAVALSVPLELRLAAPDGSLRNLAATPPPVLAAGASSTLTIPLGALAVTGSWRLQATLDPQQQLAEADESNNFAAASLPVAPAGLPQLELGLVASGFAPGRPLAGEVRVVNAAGSFEGRVQVVVLDETGVLLATLVDGATGVLLPAQAWVRALHWQPDVFAGGYQLRARLQSSGGATLAERQLPFRIEAERQLDLDLHTDRDSYALGQDVQVGIGLHFRSGNALLGNAQLRLAAYAPNGAPAWSWQRALGTLTPGAQVQQAVTWPTTGLAAGAHTLELRLLADGYHDQLVRTVQIGAAPPAIGMEGSLRVLPGSTVPHGSSAGRIEYALRNAGSTTLDPLAVRLRLLVLPTLATVAEQTGTLQLAAQASSPSRTLELGALDLALGDHLAVLEARLPADPPGSWRRLAQASVIVADGTPPAIVPERPLAGSFAPRPVPFRARIGDALSGLDRAEIRIDGGDWRLLGLVGDGRHGRNDGSLADGPHRYELRARDRQGNEAQSASIAFEVDGSAPLVTITGVVADQVSREPLQPRVEFADAHLESTRIRLNGQDFVSGSSVAAEGVYYLVASATDRAGNRSERAVAFRIDRTAPELQFLDPADGASVAGDAVDAVLQSEAFARIELVRGSYSASATADANGRASVAGVPLLPGINRLDATAEDAAGNRSAVASISITRLESAAAWAGDLTPAAAELPVGAALPVEARIHNQGGPPRSGQFRVRLRAPDGAEVGAIAFSHAFGADAVHVETLAFATTGLRPGTHVLVLELLEGANVQELDAAAVVLADRQPPQLQLLAPPALVGASVVVEATASDLLSAVVAVEARLDGGDWQALAAVPGSPGRWRSSSLALAEGPQVLDGRARDDWDNVAVASRTLLSDQSAPLIRIDGVADGELRNAPVTPLVTIDEPHPGSSSIRLNGSAFASGTTLANDGTYQLLVEASDALGNAAQRTLAFSIDRTPPAIAISQPLDGAIVLVEAIAVNGSTEALAQVELTRGSYHAVQSANAQGGFGFAAVPLEAGSNLLQLRATDRAGNVGPLRTLNVVYRLNGGVTLAAQLAAPPESAHGQPFVLEYSISNSSTQPAQALPLRLDARRLGQSGLLDRHLFSATLAPGANLSGSRSYDTAGWPLAEIELGLEAELVGPDGKPAWTPLASSTVRLLDRTPPQLAWIAPEAGSWQGAAITVEARASDAAGPIALVQARLGSEPALPLLPVPGSSDRFRAVLPTTIEGPQSLVLAATDAAGNATSLAPRPVLVDRTPPQVDISGVLDGQVGNTPVLPQVQVSDAGPTTLAVLLDGQPHTLGQPIGHDGLHLLQARATDAAGNVGSAEVRFTIDRTPPALAVLQPVDGATLLVASSLLLGSSEPQAAIELRLHGQVYPLVADGKGNFSQQLALARGPNSIMLQARDALGNASPVTTLNVTVVADPVIALGGNLGLAGTTLTHGEALAFAAEVRNIGNTHLVAVPLQVRVRAADGSELALERWSADLQVSALASRALQFQTGRWPPGRLRIGLEAELELSRQRGRAWVELAARTLQLVDRGPPELAVETPAPDQLLLPGAAMVASASDAVSAISAVEARFDDTPGWLPLAPLDATLQRYGRSLDHLAAGPHRVEVRAIDGGGNVTTSAPIPFRIQRSLALALQQPLDGSSTQLGLASFVGSSEPLARVVLRHAGNGLQRDTSADGLGRFRIDGVPLELGSNRFELQATAADGASSALLVLRVERRGLAQIQVDAAHPPSIVLLLLLVGACGISTLAARRRRDFA